MKRLNITAAVLSAALAVCCTQASADEVYSYTEGSGELTLSFSEESGDLSVSLTTVNPNNFATCDMEPLPCSLQGEDILRCYAGEDASSDVVLRLISRTEVEVTDFPSEYCGMGASAIGRYVLRQ